MCFGVFLKRVRDRYCVVRCWRAQAPSSSISNCLAEGLRQLEIDDGSLVVAGGLDLQSGMADLKMPALAPAELRNALLFELTKQAPLAADKLAWGYRVLASKETGRLPVRLTYMRDAEWSRWLEAVSGLNTGVDALLPPAVALDPIFENQVVYLSDPLGGAGLCLTPDPEGGRECRPCASADGQGIGFLPKPLAEAGIDLGDDLEVLSAEERQHLVPAILLGMYGLSGALKHDRKTLPAIPYDLRPHRHRYSKLAAMVLGVVLLGLGLIMLGREYVAASNHYGALKDKTAALSKQINEVAKAENPEDSLETLRKELSEVMLERPGLPACLLELTRLTDDDVWVQSFNWTDGKIDVDFTTEKQDAEILSKLETSPLLVDVIPQGKRVDARKRLTIRMRMYAGFRGEGSTALPGAQSNEPLDATNEEPDATPESTDEVPDADATPPMAEESEIQPPPAPPSALPGGQTGRRPMSPPPAPPSGPPSVPQAGPAAEKGDR
jgi:Tfp pilus assembly protein PilN